MTWIGTAVPQGVHVDLDRMTRHRLDALSELTDEPDLAVVILDLARTAQAAVPSFLALRVTIQGAGQPITVATHESSAGRGVVRSSLRLETAEAAEQPEHHLSMVYLAEQANAFIGFASLPPCVAGPAETMLPNRLWRLVVDEDVPAARMAGFAAEAAGPVDADADGGLIERATGALMEYGFTPEQAQLELGLWAESSQGTAIEAAQGLLLSLRRTIPNTDDLEPTLP